jgi:uncharacterized protein YegP (UPF0339 family)
MRALFTAAFVVFPAMAMAAEPTGPTYSPDQVRAFAVAGLKANMTQDEAGKLLKDSGFQGSFSTFSQDEKQANGWAKAEQTVFPFRFKAKDGSIRLWEVAFKQKFDKEQAVDGLKAKVVERYGQPTEVVGDTLIYRVSHKVDHTKVDFCLNYGNAGNAYNGVDEATYWRERRAPELRVQVTPTALTLQLPDQETVLAAEELFKAEADAAKAKQQTQNTQGTKLGF